jgi:putative peptide zinc metalloprotease protein
MAQLRLGYPELQRSGAEVLQITHNTAAEAQRYFKHYPIAFPYLCDPERAVHETYGLAMETASAKQVVTSFATAASDLVRHGEKTALPIPFMMRYGYKDSPQAVVIVDREGIVRHVVQAGPNAELPSNAEILRRLDAIAGRR